MAYIGNNLDSDIQVNKYQYTATSGQTEFACTYDRAVDVYVNGLKLSSDDFTATDGVKITLTSGANANDIIDINAYFDVTYGGYSDSQIDALIANIDALPTQTGNAGKYLQTDGADASWEEVDLTTKVDTVSSTDNAVVRFNGTTGQVQDSGVTIDDSGNMTATSYSGDGSSLTGISSYTDSDALSLFNASGSAPVYACRAWVNFNGTNTVAIRESGNVSSITDNGTGTYQINFTTAMPDINYAVVGTCSNLNGSSSYGSGDYTMTPGSNAQSTGYCYFVSGDNSSNGSYDALNNNIAIFR